MRYARGLAPPLRPCARRAWGGAEWVAPGGHYPEQSPASGQVTLGGAGRRRGREEAVRREGKGGEGRREGRSKREGKGAGWERVT